MEVEGRVGGEMYLGPVGCTIHAVHVVEAHNVYNSK